MAESLSSSEKIGGVIVEIGVNYDPVKQGVTEVRQLITDLDQQAANVKIGANADNAGIRESLNEAVTMTESTAGRMQEIFSEAKLQPTIDLGEDQVKSRMDGLVSDLKSRATEANVRIGGGAGGTIGEGTGGGVGEDEEGGGMDFGRLAKAGRFGRMFVGGFLAQSAMRFGAEQMKIGDQGILAGNDQEKQFKVDQLQIQNVESMPILGSIASLIANSVSGAGLEAAATMQAAKDQDKTTEEIKKYHDTLEKNAKATDRIGMSGEDMHIAERNDKAQAENEKIITARNERTAKAVQTKQDADALAEANYKGDLKDTIGLDPEAAADASSKAMDKYNKTMRGNQESYNDSIRFADRKLKEAQAKIGEGLFKDQFADAEHGVIGDLAKGLAFARGVGKEINADQKKADEEQRKEQHGEATVDRHNSKFFDNMTRGLDRWLTHEGKVGERTSRDLIHEHDEQAEADMIGAGEGGRASAHARASRLLAKLRADPSADLKQLTITELNNMKKAIGESGGMRLSSNAIDADKFFKPTDGMSLAEKNATRADIENAKNQAGGIAPPDSEAQKNAAEALKNLLALAQKWTGILVS